MIYRGSIFDPQLGEYFYVYGSKYMVEYTISMVIEYIKMNECDTVTVKIETVFSYGLRMMKEKIRGLFRPKKKETHHFRSRATRTRNTIQKNYEHQSTQRD